MSTSQRCWLFDMLNPGRKRARATSLLAVEAVVLSGPRKGVPSVVSSGEVVIEASKVRCGLLSR